MKRCIRRRAEHNFTNVVIEEAKVLEEILQNVEHAGMIGSDGMIRL